MENEMIKSFASCVQGDSSEHFALALYFGGEAGPLLSASLPEGQLGLQLGLDVAHEGEDAVVLVGHLPGEGVQLF